MSDLNAHIALINTKLQQLLKQYDALKKENEKNVLLVADLQKKQEAQQTHISDLHQQNLILKASLQSMDASEKRELELKLTQYIKNIDKSISLLSQ